MYTFLFNKARQLVSKNPSGVDRGLRSVGDLVDKRTGGRYSGQIRTAQDQARKYLVRGGTTGGTGGGTSARTRTSRGRRP